MKKGKLIAIIIAAVVVVAALVTAGILFLPKQPEKTENNPQTVASGELYWVVDGADYADPEVMGATRRSPNKEGIYRITFAYGGKQIGLKTSDGKLAAIIDNEICVGLTLDENEMITDVQLMDEVSGGFKFHNVYITAVQGNHITVNHSVGGKARSEEFDIPENCPIYNVSDYVVIQKGELTQKLYVTDKLSVLQDKDGNITEIFVTRREEGIESEHIHCVCGGGATKISQHTCDPEMHFRPWNMADSLPASSGNYYLNCDVVLDNGQTNLPEGADVVLCLNGHKIENSGDFRIYTTFNPESKLTLTDCNATPGTIIGQGSAKQGGVVWVRYGQFDMYNITLDGTAIEGTGNYNGVCVFLEGDTVFNMYGGTVLGGKVATDRYGGAVGLNVKATFNMYDGLIEGGRTEGGLGGNVGVTTDSVFNMYGGTIRGGKARLGGNLMVNGTFNMYGGVIENGVATAFEKTDDKGVKSMTGGHGGNIYSAGVVNISGGVIKDGKSDTKGEGPGGGNISLIGDKAELHMTGGTISGGKSMKNGGNVLAYYKTDKGEGPILELMGGKITGGYAENVGGGVYLTDGLLTIGGNMQITGNTGKAGGTEKTANNLYAKNGDRVTIQKPKSLKVGVFSVGELWMVGKAAADYSKYFTSDVGKEITYSAQMKAVYVGQAPVYYFRDNLQQCVCGGLAKGMKDHTCKTVKWQKWDSINSLPNTSGYYYLATDVSLPDAASAALLKESGTDIHIDLNGRTVSAPNGRVWYTNNKDIKNVTLTITDSAGGGRLVTTQKASTRQGAILWIAGENNNVTIFGGTLDASGYEGTGTGTTVCINGSGTVLNIYGGTFIAGKTTAQGANISIETSAVLNMYGGTITGGSSVRGGNVRVSGRGNEKGKWGIMNMYGGVIEDGASTGPADNNNGGGNVDITSYGRFYMFGGTIQNGTSATYGANLQVGGDAEFYGGTIEGGVSTLGGGNIYVKKDTKILLKDTRVLNGTAATGSTGLGGGNIFTCGTTTVQGNTLIDGGQTPGTGRYAGNIEVGDNGTLVLESGTISNGVAANVAGNVRVEGKGVFKMSGGLVTGGSAQGKTDHESANLYVLNGTVEMTGGQIDGGIYLFRRDTSTAPLATFSGTAKALGIKNGTTPDKNQIKVGLLTEGAKLIFVKNKNTDIAAGTTDTFTEDCLKYVESSVKDLAVKSRKDGDDTVLYAGAPEIKQCVCGGKAVGVGGHVCSDVTFTAWTATTCLPNTTGNYYLTADVTISEAAKLVPAAGSTVSIDLNGHTVTSPWRIFQVNSVANVTINITDSKGGGTMISKRTGNGQGAGVWMASSNNTFNMFAGTLDASAFVGNSNNSTCSEIGVAICLDGTNTSFNMYGGTVIGGKTTNLKADANGRGFGGSIYVGPNSAMTMYAGTVKDGRADAGGNIYARGTVQLLGGSLENGKASISGKGFGGGNLCVFGGTTTVDSGFVISGGTAGAASGDNRYGGNIYVNTGATLKLGKASVKNGTSTGDGGNIRNNGTIQLTSTELAIFGGSAKGSTTGTTANIQNLGTITGGTITDYVVTNPKLEASFSALKSNLLSILGKMK